MSGFILAIIFIIPLYVFLIWSYFNPDESILWGRRWMYREEPEFSTMVIRYTKFTSMITMVGLPIILISLFLGIYVLGFIILILFLMVYFVGAFKIYTD